MLSPINRASSKNDSSKSVGADGVSGCEAGGSLCGSVSAESVYSELCVSGCSVCSVVNFVCTGSSVTGTVVTVVVVCGNVVAAVVCGAVDVTELVSGAESDTDELTESEQPHRITDKEHKTASKAVLQSKARFIIINPFCYEECFCK